MTFTMKISEMSDLVWTAEFPLEPELLPLGILGLVPFVELFEILPLPFL